MVSRTSHFRNAAKIRFSVQESTSLHSLLRQQLSSVSVVLRAHVVTLQSTVDIDGARTTHDILTVASTHARNKNPAHAPWTSVPLALTHNNRQPATQATTNLSMTTIKMSYSQTRGPRPKEDTCTSGPRRPLPLEPRAGEAGEVLALHPPAENPTGNHHWPVHHGAWFITEHPSYKNFVEVVEVGDSTQLSHGQEMMVPPCVSPSHQLHTHFNLRHHRIVDGRVPPEMRSTGGRRRPD